MGKVIDFKSRRVITETTSQVKSGFEDEEFKERMKRVKDSLNKMNFLMRQLREESGREE